jgi:hypothetical protein
MISLFVFCQLCRCSGGSHSNVEMGEYVAEKVLELEPEDAVAYVQL